ncbi:MAG: hypothetical protein WC527_02100 [Candidatus Margulisiibacteriota bacterium]
MKKALLFVLAVTAIASFFVSVNPDGLAHEGRISTVSEAIAGVLITLSVFWLAAFMYKEKN